MLKTSLVRDSLLNEIRFIIKYKKYGPEYKVWDTEKHTGGISGYIVTSEDDFSVE